MLGLIVTLASDTNAQACAFAGEVILKKASFQSSSKKTTVSTTSTVDSSLGKINSHENFLSGTSHPSRVHQRLSTVTLQALESEDSDKTELTSID